MARRPLAVPLLAVLAAACTDPGPPAQTSGESSTTSTSESSTTSASETSTGTDTSGEQPACPGQTPAELMDCVDPDRYFTDLEFIAHPRTPGSPHWQEVQDLCADRLTEFGFTVERQDYGTGINVVGSRLGTSLPDEKIVIGGHYDHIPNCSGADDNGTGVAATLEAARILADIPTQRTLEIVCWDEEELGLIGSAAHAQAALDAGEQLVGVFSLDSVGVVSSEPNSQVVPDGFDLLFPQQYADLAANEFRADFLLWITDDTMAPLGTAMEGFAVQLGRHTIGSSLDDTLKKADVLSDLRRSDHASYWDRDIPAMWFNDTGEFRYGGYHCGDGDDTVDRVDQTFAIDVTKLVVATAAVALGM